MGNLFSSSSEKRRIKKLKNLRRFTINVIREFGFDGARNFGIYLENTNYNWDLDRFYKFKILDSDIGATASSSLTEGATGNGSYIVYLEKKNLANKFSDFRKNNPSVMKGVAVGSLVAADVAAEYTVDARKKAALRTGSLLAADQLRPEHQRMDPYELSQEISKEIKEDRDLQRSKERRMKLYERRQDKLDELESIKLDMQIKELDSEMEIREELVKINHKNNKLNKLKQELATARANKAANEVSQIERQSSAFEREIVARKEIIEIEKNQRKEIAKLEKSLEKAVKNKKTDLANEITMQIVEIKKSGEYKKAQLRANINIHGGGDANTDTNMEVENNFKTEYIFIDDNIIDFSGGFEMVNLNETSNVYLGAAEMYQNCDSCGDKKFIGGVDGSQLALAEMDEYANSLNAKTKENILRDIAKIAQGLNIDVTDTAGAKEIGEKIMAKLPKNGKNFKADAQGKKALCVGIAKAINSRFGNAIDINGTPEMICAQVSEMINSLSTNMHLEFLSLNESVKNILKNLNILQKQLNDHHKNVFDKISASDEPLIQSKLAKWKEFNKLVTAEINRQQTMLRNLLQVTLNPADQELTKYIKDNEEMSRVISEFGVDPYNKKQFGNVITKLLSGFGVTAGLAELTNRALKQVGITATEYGQMNSLKDLYTKLDTGAIKKEFTDEELEKYFEGVDFLIKNFYRNEDIVKKIKGGSETKMENHALPYDGAGDVTVEYHDGGEDDFDAHDKYFVVGGSDLAADDGMDSHGDLADGESHADYTGGMDSHDMDSHSMDSHGMDSHDGVSAYTGGVDSYGATGGVDTSEKKTSKLKKKLTMRKRLFKAIYRNFNQKIQNHMNILINSISNIADHGKIGSSVPITDQFTSFVDSLERLHVLTNLKNTYIFLIGYYNDALSIERRENFIRQLNDLKGHAEVLMGMSEYSSINHYLKDITSAVVGVKNTMAEYKEIINARVGAGEPAHHLKTEENISSNVYFTGGMESAHKHGQEHSHDNSHAHSHVDTHVDTNDFSHDHTMGGEECEAPCYKIVGGGSYKPGYNGGVDEDYKYTDNVRKTSKSITEAVKKINYFTKTAKVRENLLRKNKNMDFSTNYTETRGAAIASEIDKLTKQENEYRKLTENFKKVYNGEIAGKNNAIGIKSEINDGLEFVLEHIKFNYDAKKNMWRTVEAIDEYMKVFTKEISLKPNEVEDLRSMVNNLEVIYDWYGEDSGNLMCNIFDSFPTINNGKPSADLQKINKHYYEELKNGNVNIGDPSKTLHADTKDGLASLKNVKQKVKKFYSNMMVLKNIISVFLKIGDKFGGKVISKNVFMTMTQVYKNMINYLQSRTLMSGYEYLQYCETHQPLVKFDINGEKVEWSKDLLAVCTAFSDDTKENFNKILTNYVSNVSSQADHNKLVNLLAGFTMKPAFTHQQCDLDHHFVYCLKAMVAKIFTVLGFADILDRPNEVVSFNSNRVILGGLDEPTPKVEERALELYLRIPLLVNFYYQLFNVNHDTDGFVHYDNPGVPYNNKIDNLSEKITMLPDLGGLFGNLIKFMMKDMKGKNLVEYSNLELKRLVRECNPIYAKYASEKKPALAAVHALSNEINTRFGIVQKQDYDHYMTEWQDRYNYHEELKKLDFSQRDRDSLMLLPGEENMEFEKEAVTPSKQFEGANSSCVDDDKVKCTDSNPYKIDCDRLALLRMFRCKLDGLLNKTQNNENMFEKSKTAFMPKIKSSMRQLKNENNVEKRFSIVMALLRGSMALTKDVLVKNLFFHESVIAPLNALSAIYTHLRLFRDSVVEDDGSEARDLDLSEIMEILKHIGGDFGGLVEIKFDDCELSLNFSKMMSLIDDLFDVAKNNLDILQAYIPRETYKLYVDKCYNGSYYWLMEALQERLIEGRNKEARAKKYPSPNNNNRYLYVNLTETADMLNAQMKKYLKNNVNMSTISNTIDAALAGSGLTGTTQVNNDPMLLTMFELKKGKEKNVFIMPGVSQNASRFVIPSGQSNIITVNTLIHNNLSVQSGVDPNSFTGGSASLVGLFNTVIAQMLRQFTEPSSEKIYSKLFSNFINSSFLEAILDTTGRKTMHESGDFAPALNGVYPIYGSLATILYVITHSKNRIDVPSHTVDSLADVSVFIKERMRNYLPVFKTYLLKLKQDCSFYEKIINTKQLGGQLPNKDAQMRLINKLVQGSNALLSGIDSVLRELSDSPKYPELSHNFIQDFRENNHKEPLSILSNLFTCISSDKHRNALLPIHSNGTDEFKFGYSVRHLLAKPGDKVELSKHVPFYNDIFAAYNNIAESKYQASGSDKLAHLIIRTTRYLYEMNTLNTNMAKYMYAGASNIADSQFNKQNISIYSKNQLPRQNNINQEKCSVFALQFNNYNLHDVVNVAESAYRDSSIEKVVKCLAGELKCQEDDLMLLNLFDLDFVPVNVNALMRDIPLANLYNYEYNFNRLLVEMFFGNSTNVSNVLIGSMCNNSGVMPNFASYAMANGAPSNTQYLDEAHGKNKIYPKTTGNLESFLTFMVNPINVNTYSKYNLDFLSTDYFSFGTPKFLFDQLENKCLLGFSKTTAGSNLLYNNVPFNDNKDDFSYQDFYGNVKGTGFKSSGVSKTSDMDTVGGLRFATSLTTDVSFMVCLYRVLREKIHRETLYGKDLFLKGFKAIRHDNTEFAHKLQSHSTPQSYNKLLEEKNKSIYTESCN